MFFNKNKNIFYCLRKFLKITDGSYKFTSIFISPDFNYYIFLNSLTSKFENGTYKDFHANL